ncbi:MAG: hypothetical protein ACO1N3_02325 [Gammaproteobacteria bacterium]
MALPGIALAEVVDTDEAMRMKMLSDLGLPLPGSGIKIVPRAQLHLSEEQIALGKKAEEEMRTLGYAINSSDYPKELLNIRRQLRPRHTFSTVEGSLNTGFIYKIEWYDNENFHELECANLKYSSELTKSVINLAKDIDAQPDPSFLR